ncbi:2_t:CDS:2, partial [Racocetra persica]
EEFWNQNCYKLKFLGIKTSLSPVDIVERIETYIKRQETGNSDGVYDKSRNLLKYIDENWILFDDKFLSIIKSSKWIPTIDRFGNKSFSRPSECRDKKDEHLVSLILSILDYRIIKSEFRKHLGWNRRPPVKTVLEQMKLCNFYTPENVVFNLPTNLVDLPIIQLPDDYRNNDTFSKVFKCLGVREKTDIYDFINLINKIAHEANNKALNDENLSKIIAILDQVGRECNKSNKNKTDDLKDLLIPNTDAILFSLGEINCDDMAALNNDEKNNYNLSHPKISIALARELGIQMLSETFLKGSDIDFEIYEQSEPLTTRIKEIISNCSLDSLFRKFLQNADNAGAHRFSIYIDERPWHKKPDQSTLLSKEMHVWQGPAIWIYNDAKLKEKDFFSLVKLCVGIKSDDDSKIDRFEIPTAYFLTDVLSFVSGEQIVFLDPHAKFLPAQRDPPKKSRARRLPLRNIELSKQSLISQNSLGHEKILNYLRDLKDKDEHKRLIWEAKIQDLKDVRNIRSKFYYEPQVFQLDIKVNDAQKKKTTFEIWLVCTGGKPIVKVKNPDLYKFSNGKFVAHGGIAAILAQSENEPLKKPLD